MSRGAQRERGVRDWLGSAGWLAWRAPASLGVADVVALRRGCCPLLVEVKSTAAGPYERFGPADRERLSLAARRAGADAWLAWWPPRGELRFIAEAEWPRANVSAADGRADPEPTEDTRRPAEPAVAPQEAAP